MFIIRFTTFCTFCRLTRSWNVLLVHTKCGSHAVPLLFLTPHLHVSTVGREQLVSGGNAKKTSQQNLFRRLNKFCATNSSRNIHWHPQTHTHTHTSTQTNTQTQGCMCTCTCTRTETHIHTHTHLFRKKGCRLT